MNFKDFEGRDIDLKQEILNIVSDGYKYKIYVGTDSQFHADKKNTVFITAVVLHKEGRGARAFIGKNERKISKSIKEKLMLETWSSLEVGFELMKFVPESMEIVIHIDCNKSKNFESGNYVQELVGMVAGNGFKYNIKPNSWAASTVADKFSK